MPKSEAEIIRPLQVELDKARTALIHTRRRLTKEIKEVLEAKDAEKELFLVQTHEMKSAIQSMPEEIKRLKEVLSEVREHHGQLLTDLEKEVGDHKHTEDKLKGCLDQLLAADQTRIELQESLRIARERVDELEAREIPDPVPGKPRHRRSRRF